MTRRRACGVVLAAWLLAGGAATAVVAGTAADDSLALCDAAHAAGDLARSAGIARAILGREVSAAAAWRLSRALIGQSHQAADDDARRALFDEARRWAETAVAQAPDDTHGHTCLAICAGSLSSLAGGRRRLELAEDARQAAERALALDAGNDLAWLVLGVWHREVASVSGLKKALAGLLYDGVPSGASLERSEECLRRAVALAPNHVNHHRELGITLMARKRYAEAVAAFERALALDPVKPGDPGYQADVRERLADAREKRDAPPDLGLR